MKEIKLTKGKVTLVDDEDFPILSRHIWTAYVGGTSKNTYAVTYYRNKELSMARLIMGNPKGKVVDHINHDTLDNRKENLRICTIAQNNKNRSIESKNTTGYKGVSYSITGKKFRARIYSGRKEIFLGTFDTEKEAAIAYNVAALIYHGEFANLNVV